MARHSFIQMSKLPNVKGRISYITSHARQENLYATYRTADNAFWNNLARESRQEFQRSGAEGKCIEARELIIALPEVYTQYEPQQVLEDVGETENRYLTGEVRRKVIYHLYKLPQVTIRNEKVLLHDGEAFEIDGIRIECFLVPGHTWGHMVYLIDGKYLFTGDTIWLGADGGYSFISALAEDNRLAVRSLAELEAKLEARKLHPMFLTGHTGWTDNFTFAFAHKDKLCSPFKKRVHDPSAPYDAYDESDDTEERSKSGYLKGVGR